MMDVGLPLQPHTRAWLKESALAAHVAGYWTRLRSRGYAAGTRRVYLGCIAHFAHWMRRERLRLKRLDEDAVARYLAEHLPRCDCSVPVRRLVHENRAALVHLLATLAGMRRRRRAAQAAAADRSRSSGSSSGICGKLGGSPTTRASSASRSFGVFCRASSAPGWLSRLGSLLMGCTASSWITPTGGALAPCT